MDSTSHWGGYCGLRPVLGKGLPPSFGTLPTCRVILAWEVGPLVLPFTSSH